MWESQELIRTASDLGLTMVRGGAEGEVDGQRVSLAFEYQNNSASMAVVHGWMPRPLDLGLEMHRRSVTLLELAPSMIENADLDAEFSVSGDERTRVRALFQPAVCDHLVSLHRSSQDFRIRDAECTLFMISLYAAEQSTAWLERAFRGAARTVALLDEARARVPCPEALGPHAEALQRLAARRGLAWSTAPLCAEGRVDERPVVIGSRRTGRRDHVLEARLSFTSELGLGLMLRREGLLDGLRTALGGQDIAHGKGAFDRRFLVKAEPAQAARVALLFDPAVCSQLLEIDRSAGPVHIDDRAITVAPIPVGCPPERVTALLDSLAEVAARIERNLLHGGEDGGPYR